MGNKYILFLCSMVFFLLASCASYNQSASSSKGPNNKRSSDTYSSAFPTTEVAKKLQRIQNGVDRISSTANFTKYFFADTLLTLAEINSENIDQLATQKISQNQSKAGTAIAVAVNPRWAMLITNQHVVHFPDTVISYVKRTGLETKKYVRAIMIKTSQQNVILDLPKVAGLDVVVTDATKDLALVEVNLMEFNDFDITPINSKLGDSRKLQLASVIYVMGYPKGAPMVTRAIISDPNRDEEGSFLTDALFNEGISGGIILASRNNYSSFEWVGMAKTSFANKSLHLVPNPARPDQYESMEVYQDNLFVESTVQINYGMTEAIPVQTIKNFITKNHIFFLRRGLIINAFR